MENNGKEEPQDVNAQVNLYMIIGRQTAEIELLKTLAKKFEEREEKYRQEIGRLGAELHQAKLKAGL